MIWRRPFRPRLLILLALWTLPIATYAVAGLVAIYQQGWFPWILWTLPPMWLTAWAIGHLWPAPPASDASYIQPLDTPDFWTPRDVEASKVLENFRSEVADVNLESITDVQRYLDDARTLASRLAQHYHADGSDNLLHPLTLVEILAVLHLAIEDVEEWMQENVPGSDWATIGQLERVPRYANAFNGAQKIVYFGTAILNPAKLLAYPLWQKSGKLAGELQDEIIRRFYQKVLGQFGYYLIEMYSGRLRGGSKQYRARFSVLNKAIQANGGTANFVDELQDVETTIALLGQVKAGKSSLINALLGQHAAQTSLLPETRQVTRYRYPLPGSSNALVLLDTPGYSEADLPRQQSQEIQTAVAAADIVLLVLAANVPARDADLRMLTELQANYQKQRRLKPPTILVVFTHVDLLRPIGEWEPPYNWQKPSSAKEKSIAGAIDYAKEILGSQVAIGGYAAVYTGDKQPIPTNASEELVPLLIQHLDHGHASAVLKAFYQDLDKQRYKHLARQVMQLVKSVAP
ncbi:GTPase Era [Roseimaritima multifibrata]|uniref:GTPase Era n=1 Tax=Roseimaritima multifibrata TaxID=1930274 RepID=A0A517ME79_9BACT|nr:GTPase [Roseimaritima multifibrata]QDS93193.1 GTPase Era [Roseimaritima multifibrata]